MPEIIPTYTGVMASVKSSSGVTNVKDCKNEGVNSLMVESRLNIFHSKFNWRIFCDTDSWISCLKIKQILQIIITFTSRNKFFFILVIVSSKLTAVNIY